MSRYTKEFIEGLQAAEGACDGTLSSYTKLMMTAQQVSADALMFGEAQGVFSDLNEAMSLHIRARHHLARVHAKAKEIALRNEMVPTNWGDTSETFADARDTNPSNVTMLRDAA